MQSLELATDEFAVLSELLESERCRLLVEIRHTDHRSYRDELRQRLTLVEKLVERVQTLTTGQGACRITA
jgi:hypothetical protein